MYAIVNVNGCQHKVETGKFFKSEKINANVGETVEFDCLLVCDDNVYTIVSRRFSALDTEEFRV